MKAHRSVTRSAIILLAVASLSGCSLFDDDGLTEAQRELADDAVEYDQETLDAERSRNDEMDAQFGTAPEAAEAPPVAVDEPGADEAAAPDPFAAVRGEPDHPPFEQSRVDRFLAALASGDADLFAAEAAPESGLTREAAEATAAAVRDAGDALTFDAPLPPSFADIDGRVVAVLMVDVTVDGDTTLAPYTFAYDDEAADWLVVEFPNA